MSGKGDKPRPGDLQKFRENHERIFSKPKYSNGYIGLPERPPMTIEDAWEWNNNPRWYPTIDYAEVARLTGEKNRMINR